MKNAKFAVVATLIVTMLNGCSIINDARSVMRGDVYHCQPVEACPVYSPSGS